MFELKELRERHKRLAELTARQRALESRKREIDEQIGEVSKEAVQILEEVRAGIPEPSGNRFEPIAESPEHPEGLFKARMSENRVFDDDEFTELVRWDSDYINLSNTVKVTLSSAIAALALQKHHTPEEFARIAGFVAARVQTARLTGNKKEIEKALGDPHTPKEMAENLAILFGFKTTLVVEPVFTEADLWPAAVPATKREAERATAEQE